MRNILAFAFSSLLSMGLLAPSVSQACEFNVSGWPHLSAKVEHSLGTYDCKYERKNGYWWEYRCTLTSRAENANPLRETGSLIVNPEGHPSYESEFIAHGFGEEECSFNPSLPL